MIYNLETESKARCAFNACYPWFHGNTPLSGYMLRFYLYQSWTYGAHSGHDIHLITNGLLVMALDKAAA